jgi:predicted aconitase with swiveling domain
MIECHGRVLTDGAAHGPLLVLDAPISFWGGIDPRTGCVVDPRHPNCGASLSGRVLAVRRTIGSSSSSAILLELLRVQRAPAAILMGRADAILALGVIVGRELGYETIPILEVSHADFDVLPDVGTAWIESGGMIRCEAGGR